MGEHRVPPHRSTLGRQGADDAEPNYRSRLVAKDIRRKGEDAIFAPSQPLESPRSVLSLVATPSCG